MTEQPPQPPAGTQAAYPQEGQPVGNLAKEAYTPWIKRVGASLVDAIPLAVILGIGFGTGENVCVTDTYGYGVQCTSSMSGLGVAVLAIASLLAFAYWLWNWGYREGSTGSTIGKSALKFKVVGEKTGQPIGFALSLVRQIAHVVDSIICYIGYLFPLWDAKRQTLADKIMGTVCLPI